MTEQAIGGSDGEQAPTEVISVLADPRRRTLLAVLAQRDEPASLSTLATELAERESDDGEATDDQVERLCIALYHNHVPKLADVGLVKMDAESLTVELMDPEAAGEIESFLS